MDRLTLKTTSDIRTMSEGGKKVKDIKVELVKEIKVGISADEIDKLAEELILKAGGTPSFKMVPKYHWTTCINVNEGVVHGIPHKELVFEQGDLVSVDLGMYYHGFHLDTSFSLELSDKPKYKNFLETGKKALDKAIAQARVGGRIYDISKAIDTTITNQKLNVIKALVGHGVGRNLHENPQIPLFVSGDRQHSPEIVEGMTLAIEVMYTEGSGDLVLESDGWTISSRDGKIAGLYEETVAVTKKGPVVLT